MCRHTPWWSAVRRESSVHWRRKTPRPPPVVPLIIVSGASQEPETPQRECRTDNPLYPPAGRALGVPPAAGRFAGLRGDGSRRAARPTVSGENFPLRPCRSATLLRPQRVSYYDRAPSLPRFDHRSKQVEKPWRVLRAALPAHLATLFPRDRPGAGVRRWSRTGDPALSSSP